MDVSDVKKLLQAAKGVSAESKVVDATKQFAARAKAARLAEPDSPEIQAYRDFTQSAMEQGVKGEERKQLKSQFTKYQDRTKWDPSFRGADAVDEAVVKLQPQLAESAPVKVAHPFNPKEVFQFPAGTDEKKAKELVRQIIIKRVREGEEKIDLPSNLPGEKPPLDTSEK